MTSVEEAELECSARAAAKAYPVQPSSKHEEQTRSSYQIQLPMNMTNLGPHRGTCITQVMAFLNSMAITWNRIWFPRFRLNNKQPDPQLMRYILISIVLFHVIIITTTTPIQRFLIPVRHYLQIKARLKSHINIFTASALSILKSKGRKFFQ